MKNLLNKLDVETLEDLPIETLRVTQASKKEYFRDLYKKYDYRDKKSKKDISPYKLARFIIKKYLNKSFDLAFSEYCAQVQPHQYKFFKDRFQEFQSRGWPEEFKLDKQGRIQRNEKWRSWRTKRPIFIQSDDYQTELRHKKTGHPKSQFLPVYEQVKYTYTPWYGLKPRRAVEAVKNGKLLYYEWGAWNVNLKPAHIRYKAQEEDFIPVVIKGWIKYFKTKEDPEFIRLYEEKRKAKLKTQRELEAKKLEKAYSFISQTELKKKQEAELNKYNIERHGFDPITSFRK